jgi:hypothetical protein
MPGSKLLRAGLLALAFFHFTTIATAAPKTSSWYGWHGANQAPLISGAPATSVVAGNPYNFVPNASDPDGNTLRFTIRNRPAWASFNSSNGALQGVPQSANVGTYGGITIYASDGRKTAALPSFSITVTARASASPPPTTSPPSNSPPVISGSPPTTAREGALYSFQPSASDADGNALTFKIANRPSWATFNVNTGALVGTPAAGAAGTYGNIVIGVTDGTTTASLPAFTIAVTAANKAPTISGSPPTAASVGTPYAFTPTASDADGDSLTFTIANRPAWASFSSTTGRLQGTPTTAGTFGNIVIGVSDGQATAQLPLFSITVSAAANAAPKISGTPPASVLTGTSYAFKPTASDADGDTLTFSIANKPAWATFSTATGQLSGTPTAADVGTTAGIVIAVTDGEATAALPSFSVAVQASATGAATLSWQPPTTNTDGSPLMGLAGFKVYWGPAQDNYPNSVKLDNAGLASYVVNNLVPGTYYFTVTALTSVGTESAFSNVASKQIQ